MQDAFHTIVIGAGSGGLTVAYGLAQLGKSVALIEAHHVGGDCTNVGCVPSKTLIHQAKLHGSHDPAGVLAYVRQKRDDLRDKETHEFGEVKNLTLIFGRARLLSPLRVAVDLNDGGQREIMAEHIVISTGARPRMIPITGLPPERTLTNENIFELPTIPKHLAVLGGGVIGVELAFAFHKLGSRVTVIDLAPRVLTPYIAEVSSAIRHALEDRGIAVHTETSIKSYDAATNTLWLDQHNHTLEVSDVDYVLMAVGRQRNVENLGLEAVGVKVDPRSGIRTDSYGRTNIPTIYAIGDVTATSAFTHSANAQGRRVTQRIAFPALPALGDEPIYPTATFSDPEVASTGMSQDQISQRYHPNLVKRIQIDLPTQTDRGYTDDLKRGFIIVDAVRLTGKILHVTIVAPHASEMISLFTLAMQSNLSLYRLYRVVYPYPTYSSGILKAADAFVRDTLLNIRGEIKTYLRYRWGFNRPKSKWEEHRA